MTTEAPAVVKPSLKITGLHIRGLGPIRSLDLPADGLGWNGKVPDDLILIGGANGSGKTTLLRFIAEAFKLISTPQDGIKFPFGQPIF